MKDLHSLQGFLSGFPWPHWPQPQNYKSKVEGPVWMPPPETSHFGQGETEASSGKGSSPGSQCLSVGWSYGHTVQPDQAHTCLSGPCEATLSWHLCGSQPVCQELGTHISPVPSQRLHRRGITSSQQEGKRAKMSCWGRPEDIQVTKQWPLRTTGGWQTTLYLNPWASQPPASSTISSHMSCTPNTACCLRP